MSPNAALLLLTTGILLIYVELNRPGLILPGAFGLLLALLATFVLIRHDSLRPWNVLSCLVGLALLGLSTRSRHHLALGVISTTALLYGFLGDVHAAPHTHPSPLVAANCALFLGIGTSLLTTIAARARQNKGLDLK